MLLVVQVVGARHNGEMLQEFLLYANLLIFLAGALLFGYLAREVLFRPGILPGNRALRAALASLAFFYLATLVDEQIFLLRGLESHSLSGTVWDLLRAAAWIAAFPLVTATLSFSLGALGHPVARFWTWAGWSPCLGFVIPAYRFFLAGSPRLAEATASIYPLVVGHAVLNLLLSGVLAGKLTSVGGDAKAMARMMAAMQAMFFGLAIFFVVALPLDPWGGLQGVPGPPAFVRDLARTAFMGSWLLPGTLMAVFIRRENILRLSLSFRTLRHFMGIVVLVALVMAAGPALGLSDVRLYRRLVAWGLMMALVLGVFYRPIVDALLRRSRPLRRFMGRDLSAAAMEDLISRWVSFDGAGPTADDEAELLDQAARDLSARLSLEARFVELGRPQTAIFERHFQHADEEERRRAVHRLDPVDGVLAVALAREELQAVFPLWVDGNLRSMLTLSMAEDSLWGGGLDDGELQAVSLATRQLAALAASRARMAERLAEERRLAEQERLGLLGLVAASLAHEVKNPLSSIKVLAQALREDLAAVEPDGDGVHDLDAILEQIDRLDLTTREILGVARPRASTTCDLGPLVESAVYVIGADAKRRGVMLQAEIDPVGEVAGSPASWQTVIFNLILNACRHTPSGTTVEVRLTAQDDGNWSFAVRNPVEEESAEQLRRDDLQRWFEPFETDGGTGLGLALVARRSQELGLRVDAAMEGDEVVFRLRETDGKNVAQRSVEDRSEQDGEAER